MKNPLNRRLFRELSADWKKYLVLFLLMTFMIAISSGVFVGNDSMLASIRGSGEKYNIEYGHFEMKEEAGEKLLGKFENEGISIREQFFRDVTEIYRGKNGDGEEKRSTVRVFKIRNEINLACVMEGDLPAAADEIAIDRMHANNRKISVGDNINVAGKDLKVTGLVALSDYSCLFENNADVMFDAINFDVALMTEEGWNGLDGNIKYQYAFHYDTAPAGDAAEKAAADVLAEHLAVLAATGGFTADKDAQPDPASMAEYVADMNELTDFVPGYANQAIRFAENDLGKDKAMMNILVYVFIAVLTFIFAITTANKIKEEAAVIGTLRATGYTRGEILRFYMLIPVMITLISAIAGNILGYTVIKDLAVSLYYNSYSLLRYETLWNPKAFVLTTIIPLVIMVVVNFAVIYRLLRLSPLKFLRRDLGTSRRQKARKLPSYKFLTRFRLRILLQNKFDFLVLFLGIIFIMILLGFSVGLPETLDHYRGNIADNMLADYQYVLKNYTDSEGNEIATKEASAEKYSMTSLVTVDGVTVDEGISAYGIFPGSKFVSLPGGLAGNEVYVSSAYRDKFLLRSGNEITLKEKYSERRYTFRVAGEFHYPGGLAIFMPAESFNEIFGKEDGSFTGFFSDNEIADVDEQYIYSVITEEDAMRLSNQLEHSMGFFADYISIACLIMGILVIYLLTKIIIEKNAVSISMVKVLGYTGREIRSLYIRITSIVTVILTVISAFLAIGILAFLFRQILYSMTGWFDLYISPFGIIKMILILLVSYFIVSFIAMRQIKKIPLTEALKNVE